jgi:regulator of sirC expression with transglutaminase-like and TPR domain
MDEMTMSREEIQALLQLLDDPNNEVNQTVTSRLLEQGPTILPDLEAAWEGSMDPTHQERIINLIQEIQTQYNNDQLQNWVLVQQHDLLRGVFLIARYQYPELEMKELEISLNRIIKDVWLELNNNLTALEKVRILNHIIYDVHGFTRNTKNFYNPQNSFINQVLETGKGNPISLAVVYSIIAQRLNLPIFGVNLPKNFILAYKDELMAGNSFTDVSDDVLFYINPYNRGAVLGRREIEYFLKQQKIKPHASHFRPCSNLEIIIRILHNLINAYHKSGYREKVELFEGVLNLVSLP